MKDTCIKSRVVSLTQQLVRAHQMGAADENGAQPILIHRLEKLGFVTKSLPSNGRPNFWAFRGESSKPIFAFSGHTDVVPPGDGWTQEPFGGEIVEDRLFGRGVSDMKGPIAAFVVALEEFLLTDPDPQISLGLLIAGDEETASLGTPAILEYLTQVKKKITWCLVGEPTSTEKFGDVIKVGRRGSIGGRIKIRGVQGHVAYPHLAVNPIHQSIKVFKKLLDFDFDKDLETVSIDGDEGWPKTSLQITTFSSGIGGAANIISLNFPGLES